MLISEIKNKEVRELAEHYARTMDGAFGCESDKDKLVQAFDWDVTQEGGEFWEEVYEGRDPAIPPNVSVLSDLPRLPTGWKYTRAYRQPNRGEYIMYQGEVKQARGQKGWYHIVARSEG